jgi:hypothetical protein
MREKSIMMECTTALTLFLPTPSIKPSNRLGFEPGPACGGKTALLARFPYELSACKARGGDATLIILADVDDDCIDCEELKCKYHEKAKESGITEEEFEKIVFIFPKDRIENWIEFLNTGSTDENREGPRVSLDEAKIAAKKLAEACKLSSKIDQTFPPSLLWSCRNWRVLAKRMHS